jgi:phosphotransferase system enzyme I (PtsI)
MISYNGKSVYGGIAIGKIHVMLKNEQRIVRHRVENTIDEMARFEPQKMKLKISSQDYMIRQWQRSAKQMPPYLKSIK